MVVFKGEYDMEINAGPLQARDRLYHLSQIPGVEYDYFFGIKFVFYIKIPLFVKLFIVEF